MRVKFLADANFSRRIIKGRRRREPLVDFQTTEEANLLGKPDFEVLEIAASQGRVLVTHDRKTMPGAFGAFATERQSSGILIVPQSLPVVVAIEELLLVWTASDAEDWINMISPIPLQGLEDTSPRLSLGVVPRSLARACLRRAG
jgi:Domain of unknown function (DUF5615)